MEFSDNSDYFGKMFFMEKVENFIKRLTREEFSQFIQRVSKNIEKTGKKMCITSSYAHFGFYKTTKN